MTGPVPQRTSAPVAPRAQEYASVAALRDLYRARAASPVEVMQELYARIDRYESSLHCFVTQTRDIALARARAAEKMLLQAGADALTGIPYGLKDVINTAGVLTTGQSKIL
ncbi:MAG TPA: amidase family protein, partial [Burkholderiales bacterium]|nr:amidase family protein [Burkholderiales bacterium]